MHEMAVTQEILQTALRYAAQADATRVTRLNLVIGELSSMVDDSVQFYWDFMAVGTIAEGAELHFDRIPARMACRGCGAEFGMRDFAGECPTCHGQAIGVTGGDEFQLASIEVEDAEPVVKND